MKEVFITVGILVCGFVFIFGIVMITVDSTPKNSSKSELNALNASNYKEFDIVLCLGMDRKGNDIEWKQSDGGKGVFGIDSDNYVYYIKTPTYFNYIKHNGVSVQGIDKDNRKCFMATEVRGSSMLFMLVFDDNSGYGFELPFEALQYISTR